MSLQQQIKAVCGTVKISSIWMKLFLGLLGAISLVSGAFALNAALKAETETENFEKVLFGSQIATGTLLVLFSLANLLC